MRGKAFLAGVAVLATGLIFVTGGGAATVTTVTLTVNSTADSTTPCTIASNKSTGTCSLRGAILAANALQQDNTTLVIKLAAKTYTLSLGYLDVDAATANTGNIVQIVGATKTTGKGKHKKTTPASTIDGSGNAKPNGVFEIYSPTQMSNLVITGGSGDEGGGIYTESALDIENSIVQNNTSCANWTGNSCTAGDYQDGGGIYLASGSSISPHLLVTNTTVTKNVASFGGGIDNENGHASSVVILRSHIDKNVACDTFSNGVCIGGGSGGGIADDGESLLVEYSTVNGNQAGSPAYDINKDESWGGGIYTDEDTTQLFHTVVSGNVSGNYGGGVYAYDLVDFVDSTVSNNIADYEGGGVYYDYLLTSKNSTFKGNIAGGTFECTIGASTTCKHTAKTTTGKCASLYPSATSCINYDGYGGGLYSDGEFAQFIAATISNNVAVSTSGDASNCGGGQGGGIYTDWAFTLSGGSKVTNNAADCGGGLFNYYGGTNVYTFDLVDSSMTKNSALEDGGAIWTGGPGSGTLSGMTIKQNHAGRNTGGVWDDQLGAVLLGSGDKITKNTSTGSCKNVTWPCS